MSKKGAAKKKGGGGRTTKLAYLNVGAGERIKQRFPSNLLLATNWVQAALNHMFEINGIPAPLPSEGVTRGWLCAVGIKTAAERYGLKMPREVEQALTSAVTQDP